VCNISSGGVNEPKNFKSIGRDLHTALKRKRAAPLAQTEEQDDQEEQDEQHEQPLNQKRKHLPTTAQQQQPTIDQQQQPTTDQQQLTWDEFMQQSGPSLLGLAIHIYTAYIRYFWLNNHQIFGVYIRIYTCNMHK